MSPKVFIYLLSVFCITGLFVPSLAQTINEPLAGFEKVVVSPLINLVLIHGDRESIRIEYEGIEPEKINFSVKGKKLRIYLDDAKYTVKTEEVEEDGVRQKVPVYRGVEITAFVTYRSLEGLQIRGEETVSCKDSLVSDKFKIRQFGESHVDLAFLQTSRLKARLYGENELTVLAGDSKVQKYRLFGENRIRTGNMNGEKISTSSFGENDLNLYASDKIRLWGFGEVKMHYSGDPRMNRLVIGEASVTQW